jgi:cytochrome c oxidase subunit 2
VVRNIHQGSIAAGGRSLRLTVMVVIIWLCGNGLEAGARESMLYPSGPVAERIAGLWWEMLLVYGSVFGISLLLLVLALLSRRRERPVLGTRFVLFAGIVMPTVILVVMLISTIRTTVELGNVPAGFHIKVNSHHWWFAVEYPEHGIVDANEIHIPVGTVVQFDLQSDGAVHSFWVPQLGGKRDMLPDHPTQLRLMADQPGVFRGTCTEYCAGPHALMAFRVVAHAPDQFEQWLGERSQPPPEPTVPLLVQGRRVFLEGGCAACHSIRGLSKSQVGPDLTHLGSRRTLGAGTVRHTLGTLSGWIADPQPIKPRSLMPPSYLPPEDLHALATYLRSLK